MTSCARLAALLLLVAVVGGLSACGAGPGSEESYFCPMHPTYVADRPGECPICHMRLVPVPDAAAVAAAAPSPGERRVLFYRSPMDPSVTSPGPARDGMGMEFVPVYAEPAGGGPAVPGLASIELSPQAMALSGVRTDVARRERLERTVRTVGIVTADERREWKVHSRTAGWIERLHASETGMLVRRGEPLLALYSPELLASQEELLRVLAARERLAASGLEEVRRGGEQMLEAARRRLQLFDVPPGFLSRLERRRQASRTVDLPAPVSGHVTARMAFAGSRVEPGDALFTITDLGRVWIEAEVYEREAPFVHVGEVATLSLPDDPTLRLEARVSHVHPMLDAQTRTLMVRFEVDNPALALKPSMYVDVSLRLEVGEGVVVPDSAVIDTGLRQVAFVEGAPGRLEPREVRVGMRGEGRALLLSGVEAGERVVTQATFLVDSESRLRAAIAAVAPPPLSPPASAAP